MSERTAEEHGAPGANALPGGPLPADPRVEHLLAQMTLDEKLAQIGSVYIYDLLDETGFSAGKAARLADGIGQVTRLGTYTLLTPRQRAETANAIQAYLVQHTRLGIPAIFHDECCAGFAALGGTCFPQSIGLASTFRPDLAEAMAGHIRAQMRATGSHQGLSPVLDVCRDPRWGRSEETFGEDPLLVARFGAAYIHGLQGGDLRQGVLATGKHFLAHSIAEGGMNCAPVHVGPRVLRETYLLPYEAAVREAGMATIMHSYSELDGRVVAADPGILRGLLRDELGFTGLLVSDYLAVDMLHTFHRVAEDWRTAAVKALRAGIELELPETHCYGAPLREALERGEVQMAEVDDAVRRVLAQKFALGLFEQPFVAVDSVEALYQSPEPRALAREIAAQSLVLLKNDGPVLPFDPGVAALAVIGPNAHNSRSLFGDYSYPAMHEILLDGIPGILPLIAASGEPDGYAQTLAAAPTLLDAIRARVSPATRILYAQGCLAGGSDRSGFAEAVAAAQQADAIVLALGDLSGLAPGCTTGEFNDRAELHLPGVQLDLVQAVLAAAPGKPVAAVLINGRPLALTRLYERVPALLEAWLPGQEGAAAVADALFGAVNPGGKLPVSLPRASGQIPVFYNHKPSGGHSHIRGDYADLPAGPLLAFGHGLSYTRFAYANLTLDACLRPGGVVTIAFDVQNVGALAGDEVAQVYIQDEYACVPRPVQELKAFRRVTLHPGQTAHLTFTLTPAHLAYYDEDLRLVVEPGTIRVMVGGGSRDIRLEGALTVSERMAVQARATRVDSSVRFSG